MASPILVVYYTRTGHTQRLADRIAGALGADLEAIVDRVNRRGLIGFLRSGYESIRERLPEIAPSVHGPALYSMVVIGTPVWSSSMASPIRSYLARHRGALRSVAFFCTYGGSGADRAFAGMANALGTSPVSTLAVREAELERSPRAVERFIAEVRAAAEAERAPRIVQEEAPTFT